MAVKIAICNQKGGVGKTTSVIELAACMRQMDYSVLVIDLDQQANLTNYVGGYLNDNNIFRVLKGEVDIKDAIQHASEFDLIPSSESLSKASKELGEAKDVLNLRKVLREINDNYDFIFIDNSPARDVLLNMSYIAADYLIIPAEAEEGSINGIRAIWKDLLSYRDIEWSNAEIMGIILTKTERTSMHEYGKEMIRKLLHNEIKSNAFFIEVRKSITASECKSEGTSMQAGKHSSNPALDYRYISDVILERVTADSDKTI